MKLIDAIIIIIIVVVVTANRVDLWRNLCTSLLYFVVRV